MAGLLDTIRTGRDYAMDVSDYWPQGGIVPAGAWQNPYYRPSPILAGVDAFMRGMQGASAKRDAKEEREYRRRMEEMAMQLQQNQDARAGEQMRFAQAQHARGLMQDQANKRAMLGLMNPAKALEYGGTGNRSVSRVNALPDVATMAKMQAMQKPAELSPGVQEFFDVNGRMPKDMKEYLAFHSGKKGPGTQIINNTGDQVDPRPIVNKPEAGFQRRWDEGKKTWIDEPIPGGTPSSEKETRARTAGKAGAIAVRELDLALGLLGADPETGRLTRDSEVFGPRSRALAASGVGRIALAGTKTGDFMGTLQSIKDTIAIERLLEIKASGAGLGQVPQSQLEALARALGNLNPEASNELLAKNLADVRKIYADVVDKSSRDANDETFSGILKGIARMDADAEADALIKEALGGK